MKISRTYFYPTKILELEGIKCPDREFDDFSDMMAQLKEYKERIKEFDKKHGLDFGHLPHKDRVSNEDPRDPIVKQQLNDGITLYNLEVDYERFQVYVGLIEKKIKQNEERQKKATRVLLRKALPSIIMGVSLMAASLILGVAYYETNQYIKVGRGMYQEDIINKKDLK